jgi:integrase
MNQRETKNKEIVRLRQKPLVGGNFSLYLDIYWKGERAYDFLNLYINPGETQLDRELNKSTWELAERIKAQRVIDIQSGKHKIYQTKTAMSFLEYFKQLAKNRLNSLGNYGNWDSCYKHLQKFADGKDITFADVDEEFLTRFKRFLVTEKLTKSNTRLSQNSCYSYYNKVVAALREAYGEKIIMENPTDRVKGIKPGESKREFLTWEEVQKITETKCEDERLKTAFLFSVLTGLRWGDVVNLTWDDIRGSESAGWHIRFQQQKTKGHEVLPITPEARNLLGESKAPEYKVFGKMRYTSHVSVQLGRWMMRAGIDRKITFHCARHTHATLLLSNGVDIYVVSKLLGHKHIHTTEIYAKVTNIKKNEAISKLPKLSLTPSGQ